MAELFDIADLGPQWFIKQWNWITVNSIKFKKNVSVLLCPVRSSVHKAQFGVVINCVSPNNNEDNPVFVVKMLRTLKFVNHYQAYKVYQTDCILTFPLDNILNFQNYVLNVPAFKRQTSNALFIVSKTEIQDLLFKPKHDEF